MELPPTPDSPENENFRLHYVPPFIPEQLPPEQTFMYWVKKLLVCNPFYLVSAATLLYGFYLVASDANFPGKEFAQLVFNLGSLQFYEVLLIATALLLARRHIYYDSNLLIFLENLLILVPFILLSQAALLNQNTVWVVCLVTGAMVLVRFGALKRFHKELNLPRGLLAVGLVLLLVNVALPLIFRQFQEHKISIDGAPYEMNRFSWLFILPAIIALANCLPRPAQLGNQLPQRRWLPTGLFTLWLAGSAVHLYCLSYVYNYVWEKPFIIPALWMLAWTIFNRHGDFLRIRNLSHALLALPFIVTLLPGARMGVFLFLIVTGLNILLYAFLFRKQRTNKLAFHLMLLSLAELGLGFVKQFESHLPLELTAGKCVLAFIAAYACFWIIVSRHPKFGIAGAIIVGITTGVAFSDYFESPNFAIQSALFFLMLHSLLWKDEAHPGARGGRIFACTVWILHSLLVVSINSPHAGVIVSTGAATILAICTLLKLIHGQWPPLVLPISAAIALLIHPSIFVITKAQSTPIGLWVVAGSFVLFAIGTLLALTKSKWNPSSSPVAPSTHRTH
ncbi:MAG: hypothetical protein JWQ71_56 [Pedosphaera sp.]|nr:hypothetical protein [Pedosphaera sp.]